MSMDDLKFKRKTKIVFLKWSAIERLWMVKGKDGGNGSSKLELKV